MWCSKFRFRPKACVGASAAKAFDGAVSEHFIDRCAACEELSPGVAARTAGVVKTLSGEVDADETAEKLINATLMAQFGKGAPAALNNGQTCTALRLSTPNADLDAIAEGLKLTRSGAALPLRRTGDRQVQYVRWLAARLDMPLVIKRASDLLSPFVGMTEKPHCRRLSQCSAAGGGAPH